jgi:hypothetical protein
MADPGKIAQGFLEGLHSKETNNTVDMLQRLIEVLENKADPDMTEVRLVDSMYNFLEKLRVLDSNLTSYVRDTHDTSYGGKLAMLYDDISPEGSIYRD